MPSLVPAVLFTVLVFSRMEDDLMPFVREAAMEGPCIVSSIIHSFNSLQAEDTWALASPPDIVLSRSG